MMPTLLVVIFILFFFVPSALSAERYKEPIFEVEKIPNLVYASGVPHLYSDSQGWRVSPLYLQNAAKWQYEYEPVIQRACIEASANGLETVRINTDTGEIDGSDYALQPIAGMENIIRRVVSGDILVENGINQLVLRWDEYPDE